MINYTMLSENIAGETDVKLNLQTHFPVPDQSVKIKPRPRKIMKKMPKIPPQRARLTCDADNMKTKKFDKDLNFHSGQSIIKQEDTEAGSSVYRVIGLITLGSRWLPLVQVLHTEVWEASTNPPGLIDLSAIDTKTYVCNGFTILCSF